MSEQEVAPARFSPVHAFGLAAFALALPLFTTLAGSPEFFLAHGFRSRELIEFALALGIGAPCAAALLVVLLNALPTKRREIPGTIAAGAIAALAIIPTANRIAFLPGTATLPLALVLGTLAAHAYLRHRILRDFCGLLAIAALAYPPWFLWRLDVFQRAPALPAETRSLSGEKPPVVWVIFDEFSVEALLDDEGQLDAEHFPHFAELASMSYWFRDTTAVAEMTTEAVPAILTGRYPREDRQTNVTHLDHPVNLFTLFHAAGYRVFANEIVTQVCPPTINAAAPKAVTKWRDFAYDMEVISGHLFFESQLGTNLPDIQRRVAHFAAKEPTGEVRQASGGESMQDESYRASSFREFVRGSGGRDGELRFLHVLLPHYEYQFLPSGKQYLTSTELERASSFVAPESRSALSELERARTELPYPLALARQRYLLQAQFVDRLVGELLQSMRDKGVLEKCILVVGADHGVSFRPGMSDRIAIPQGSIAIDDIDHGRDILKAPLFIKPAGAFQGERVDTPAQTIDALPTVMHLAGVPPREMDGRSLLSGEPRQEKHLLFSSLNRKLVPHEIGADAPGYLPSRSQMNDRAHEFRPRTAWDGSYLDKASDELPVRSEPLAGVRISSPWNEARRAVDRNSYYLPAYCAAPLTFDDGAERPDAVAIAMQGRIVAIAIPFDDSRYGVRACAMLPESEFVDGDNTVQFFGIVGTGADAVIAPIEERDPK